MTSASPGSASPYQRLWLWDTENEPWVWGFLVLFGLVLVFLVFSFFFFLFLSFLLFFFFLFFFFYYHYNYYLSLKIHGLKEQLAYKRISHRTLPNGGGSCWNAVQVGGTNGQGLHSSSTWKAQTSGQLRYPKQPAIWALGP